VAQAEGLLVRRAEGRAEGITIAVFFCNGHA
jgi:hypothetical protein